jgi:fatty-acyl-CoA synthase
MTAYDYPLTLGKLLITPIAQKSAAPIVHRGRRFSYPTFVERLGRLANVLSAAGVGMGDRVGVLDWDSHRYLECYFAVPMMGAVLMMANPRLAPEQLAYTLNHAGVKVLLVHPDFIPLFQAVRDHLPAIKTVIALSEDHRVPEGLCCLGAYEALLEQASPSYSFPELDERTTATTFYTTGTTGLPKGVYFSHRQLVLHSLTLLANIALASRNGRVDRETVYMPLTPMFHVHAWGFPYVATLGGLKQVYPGRYLPAEILRLIAEEGVTFSHCVPTILQMVLTAPESARYDLSRWQVVIGGSALPRGLFEAARARGIEIYTGYGLSETCPVLSVAQVKPGLEGEAEVEARISAGLPVVLAELRTVDDAMRDTPPGVPGEIVARTPSLTPAYAGDAEASQALWRGGWLHTGDVGYFDEEGYLHITDRIKDVIKSGGEWISSLAIESLISAQPGVGEVAVIGVPDPRWGERPLVLIVPRPGETVNDSQVREAIDLAINEGKLPRYAMPEHVRIVEELPKTSVGKLDKKALRARYGAG